MSSPNNQSNPAGAIPVYQVGAPVTYLPANASVIVVADEDIVIFLAETIENGAWITNDFAATESFFVNPTGGVCGIVPGGAVVELQPGQSIPLGRSTTAITGCAHTVGHKISALRY